MYLIPPVTDLNRLLSLEPTNRPALDELSAMVMHDGQSSNVNWPGDEELQLTDPRDIEHPLEIDDSDINPFNALAIGDGEQCTAWNHDWCKDVGTCSFKHATDGLSVRDDLYMFFGPELLVCGC